MHARVTFDRDAPHEAARRYLHGWPVDAELGLAMHVAQPPAEQQAVLAHLQGVLALAARAAFLDGEHVGEVGRDLQLDDHRHRGWRRCCAARSARATPNRAVGGGRRSTRGSCWLVGHRPTDERGAAGIDEADRERLDVDSADEQSGLAEHAHVGEEHAVGRVGAEVARAAAEAERLAVDRA